MGGPPWPPLIEEPLNRTRGGHGGPPIQDYDSSDTCGCFVGSDKTATRDLSVAMI